MIQLNMREGRASISLGKLTRRQAVKIKEHINDLEQAKKWGIDWSDDTKRWLRSIDPAIARKLSECGLIEHTTLNDYIRRFLAEYTKTKKPRSVVAFGQATDLLLALFGREKLIDSFTSDDAWLFESYIADKGYAQSTRARFIKTARRLFRPLCEGSERVLSSNPFAVLKAGSQVNEQRLAYVPIDTVLKVLKACPNARWKSILVLARFAGARTPSEICGMTWQDINWESSRLTLRSPKTEAYAGGSRRVLPMFPIVEETLSKRVHERDEGDELVIGGIASGGTNLRTQLLKCINKAKVEPWPKLFQNLRASLEMDLIRIFPAKTVMDWMGHTKEVSLSHYQKTIDLDWDLVANPQAFDFLREFYTVGSDRKGRAAQALHSETEENP